MLPVRRTSRRIKSHDSSHHLSPTSAANMHRRRGPPHASSGYRACFGLGAPASATPLGRFVKRGAVAAQKEGGTSVAQHNTSPPTVAPYTTKPLPQRGGGVGGRVEMDPGLFPTIWANTASCQGSLPHRQDLCGVCLPTPPPTLEKGVGENLKMQGGERNVPQQIPIISGGLACEPSNALFAASRRKVSSGLRRPPASKAPQRGPSALGTASAHAAGRHTQQLTNQGRRGRPVAVHSREHAATQLRRGRRGRPPFVQTCPKRGAGRVPLVRLCAEPLQPRIRLHGKEIKIFAAYFPTTWDTDEAVDKLVHVWEECMFGGSRAAG